jgi:hypothetical protein
MADVTTVFAGKDESLGATVENLNKRLQGFQAETQSFTSKVGEMAKGFAAFAIPIAGVAAAFFGARGAAAAFTDAIRVGGELNDLAARTGETAGKSAPRSTDCSGTLSKRAKPPPGQRHVPLKNWG